jgi:hypothetical protein
VRNLLSPVLICSVCPEIGPPAAAGAEKQEQDQDQVWGTWRCKEGMKVFLEFQGSSVRSSRRTLRKGVLFFLSQDFIRQDFH